MVTRSRIVLMAALVALAGAPSNARSTPSAPVAEVGKCRMFPGDNHWNLRVDDLPVRVELRRHHPKHRSQHRAASRFRVRQVPGRAYRHPVRVRSARSEEGARPIRRIRRRVRQGPFPIPRDAPIEGGRDSDGDRHVIVVQRGACKLIELYHARPVNGGRRWVAGSGATWDLSSNRLRPKGWTSADAAGLPILPGLARYPEVKSGSIDHALRFTVSETRRRFIYPARHYASSSTSKDLPAMGQRLRLKKGYDISGFSRQAKVVLRALKRYGMIVADNGSDWYISGAPHRGWDNDALHELDRVTGKSFVVVDTSKLPRPD